MPVLGMRGTGSFTATGQHPENWRQGIMRIYPNGQAPLTAILSMMASESTDSPIYHWYDQTLPTMKLYATAGFSAAATQITVDDGSGTGTAKYANRGTLLLNETTGEIMRVTQDPGNETTLDVQRGFGTTAADVILDNDVLHAYSTAYEQGANVPTALTFDPTPHVNYTQIMRRSLAMTRTAMVTRLRTGAAYEQAKIEALDLISMDIEKAFLYGELYSGSQGGFPITTTKGLINWIPAANKKTVGGNITLDLMSEYMELFFKYGSNEKLMLCGSTFMRHLNALFENKGVTINAVAKDDTYGLKLKEWDGPFGTLYFKTHPLMSHDSFRANDALIIDVSRLKYRYIEGSDLKFLQHRQNRGQDARIDEFLVECGLEVHNGETHGCILNVTGYA